MANETAQTSTINFVPVQGVFTPDAELVTLIGPAGTPFYATPNPDQSGLHITNSTIDSTTIGATTPSTGVFLSGQVNALPVASTDIANKQYVDAVAAGLSWKMPVAVATTISITLSGLQEIDGYTTLAGDRVLVKNQATASQNGIYVAAAGAWARSADANTWDELVSAITFVEYGTLQKSSAFYCTAQPGGTLGVTDINWSNFSVAATYTAGTGLTLAAYQFSITNTGVTAATKGSASKTVTAAVNAQGQLTSLTDQDIAIAATQITSGTIDTARISGSYTGITGVGTLGNLTVTNTISGSISGNAATATTAGSATTATTATNLAGGASGSVPYQTASGATSMLAAGSNGQVLTLASGVPSWATPTTGTVTSVSGAGTVNGLTLTGTVTSSGSLTLGGTLDLSAPPAIGGTTANTITGTTVTATTAFKGTYYDASGSGGGALRTNGGTACLQWGAGGGTNVTVDGAININGANAQVDISPTGTGHVHINPTGVNSVQINPTYVGTMDNITIGATTAVAGTFSTLRINSTLSLAGSTGTSGYVLTSNGASAPTWSALPSSGLTITDDTSTNASRYLTFTSATSGSITGANTSSTKLSINPSTGLLSGIALTLAGTTSAAALKVPNIKEVATVSATAASGTINYDITTQSVLYYTTNASANWTVNFRGSSGTSLDTVMATGESMSATFMVTQGATAYYNSAVTIDGNSVTPKWQGGTAPASGNVSGIDIYTYVIIKTGSATFTVLASQTQFK
jgi:hypothetical protein